MAAGDIYRVTAQQLTATQSVYQWVWHYIQTAGGDIAASVIADAIVTMLDTAWANIDQHISNTIDGDQLEIAKWDAGAGVFDTIHTESLTGHLDGASSDEIMPHQDAMVIKFFTAIGRSIGKKFISGFSVNAVSAQGFIATAVTDAALFALDFVDPISAGGGTFQPGNYNPDQGTFRQWLSDVEALVLVRTQDRRAVGIGI